MSIYGTIFRKTLNVVTPKFPTASASPQNKGFKKFINGAQGENGEWFQFGLKHQILRTGYKETLDTYTKMATGCTATGHELSSVYKRIPRILQQAFNELVDLKAHGVKF